MSTDPYQAYLHQRNKKSHKQSSTRPVMHHYLGEKVEGQREREGDMMFYPAERVVNEWEDRQVREQVPVKRKVVHLEERRKVEQVPREVVHKDYYAVEYLRSYVKQVVPEVVVEKVQVPKTVTRVESVPQKKQIIYYPPHLDSRQAPALAKAHLIKQGVTVFPDAEYRPLLKSLSPDSKLHSANEDMVINVRKVERTPHTQPNQSVLQPQPTTPYKIPSRLTQTSSSSYRRTSDYPRYDKNKYRFGSAGGDITQSLLLSDSKLDNNRNEFSFGDGTKSDIYGRYLFGGGRRRNNPYI